MPMKPHKGESQDDFMGRCVPEMMGDGKRDQDQAVAACLQIWRDNKKEATMSEFADPGYRSDGKKRYPLDTPDDIRCSWYLINTKNKEYNEAQLSRIKLRITAAWKTQIGKEGPPTDKTVIAFLRKEVVQKADVPDPDDGESHEDFMDRCMDECDDMADDDAEEACQMAWDDAQDNGDDKAAGLVMHKTRSTEGSGMEFILSDATPDRFGDIVEPAGWKITQFKKNPIALFNHQSSFPIGKWEDIKAGPTDLRAKLVLAPRGTSDRIDEIRNLIDADILRATSVGFKPIKYEPLEDTDNFGVRYTEQELMECSVVAVPANPNALAVAKSLGVSRETLRMVFGEDASRSIVQRSFTPAVRGEDANKRRAVSEKKPGEHAEIKPGEGKGKSMLLSQRIQEAQKKVLSLQDNLDKHLESYGEDPTEEQMVLTEDFTAKIENAQRNLKSLQAAEARNGERAEDPAALARSGKDLIKLPPGLVLPKKKAEPLDYLFRAALVMGKSKSEGQSIDAIRQRIYGDDEVTRVMCDMILKATSAPAMTTVTGWAAELVRTIWADFMQVLLPVSIYPQLAAKGLALTFGANGRIVIPTRNLTPSISGSFVGEGQPIPVRQGAFASQTLTPKKMAVITTWTREMDEYSIPAIEGLLRQAILEDTAIAMDAVLIGANVATAIAPPGLRSYQTGLTPSAAGVGFPNFVADYKALYGGLLNLTNGNVRRPTILINPIQGLAISMIQPPAAATPLFPFIVMMDAGRLLKADLIESANVPPGMVIMVDAADFVTAGAEGPRMEISDQATLHMEDTTPQDITGGTPSPAVPVKSMWQTDSLALRMIMRMNWILRRPVVSWMTGVQWG
jgi:HK97 family phage prohead protease/HK97 family phage major capsid protein